MRWVSEPAARSILPVWTLRSPASTRVATSASAQRQRDWINRRQYRISQIGKHQQQTHSLFITNNVISDENIDQCVAMWRMNEIVDSH